MNNLISKRFILSVLALLLLAVLILLKYDIILTASAIAIVISPFITSETFINKKGVSNDTPKNEL